MAFFKPGYKPDVISKCADEKTALMQAVLQREKEIRKQRRLGWAHFWVGVNHVYLVTRQSRMRLRKGWLILYGVKFAGNMNNLLEGIPI